MVLSSKTLDVSERVTVPKTPTHNRVHLYLRTQISTATDEQAAAIQAAFDTLQTAVAAAGVDDWRGEVTIEAVPA